MKTLISLFSEVADISAGASVAILFVLAARLLLKRAPKVFSYALWAIVLLRLLVPVTVESPISAIPQMETTVTQRLNEALPELEFETPSDRVENEQSIAAAERNGGVVVTVTRSAESEVYLTILWLCGMGVMALYGIIAYFRVRRRVRVAVPLRENIFLADDIGSPFVIGLFRPRIYLPCNLNAREQEYILLHEQHHIRRLDHVVKALAFLALTIHWFNPLVWAAFVLASRDMEMSCDEAVIRRLGEEVRAEYSASLLTLATGRRVILGTPLAFGEGDPKGRIKNLANWRKPAFWVVLVAVILCIVLAVCLLTDPVETELTALPQLYSHSYGVVEVTYQSGEVEDALTPQVDTPTYAISEDMELLSKGEFGAEDWTNLGTLTELKLSRENFDKLFLLESGWEKGESASDIRKNNAKAWSLVYHDDVLYYVLQQKNGEMFLAQGYYDYGEKNDPASDDTCIRQLYRIAVDLNGDYGIVVRSGEEVVPLTIFPAGTTIGDAKEQIFWLTVDLHADNLPFQVYENGEERGWVGNAIDAETFKPVEYVVPFGLEPQANLFQNADPEREYIVVTVVSEEEFGYFGVRFLKEQGVPDWGVTLSAENVTPTGLTIVCTQFGGGPTGQLQSGSPYVLQVYGDGRWETAEHREIENLAWTSEAWIIPMFDSVRWEVNWGWLYGELEPGHYRIGKSITDFRGTGDFDEAMFYAEFDIP